EEFGVVLGAGVYLVRFDRGSVSFEVQPSLVDFVCELAHGHPTVVVLEENLLKRFVERKSPVLVLVLVPGSECSLGLSDQVFEFGLPCAQLLELSSRIFESVTESCLAHRECLL